MAVYQPTAAVGNSRALATLGPAGEIMTFFFPHLDYAQNVREGMPAVYIGRPGLGHLFWCFDPAWQTSQRYRPGATIVETTLEHRREQLLVTFTDLMPPGRSLLARLVTVRNQSPHSHILTVYQYLALQLGELTLKNSVRYLVGRSCAVQYWRSIAMAAASSHFEQYQCGRVGAAGSAKRDLEDGHLSGQAEEIGGVDLALGWDLTVPAGDTQQRLLVLAAAETEPQALELALGGVAAGFDELAAATEQQCRQWLGQARRLDVPQPLGRLYDISLLGSALLWDEHYHSMVAAPEFDPSFESSGGYGYCWPRDAAEVVTVLARAGYPDYGRRFFDCAGRAQAAGGYWEQRYWLNGERGPSWCTFDDALQIDQTASVLSALAALTGLLPAAEQDAFLDAHWPMAERAVAFLVGTIGPDGLHSSASDLWETFRGSFTYSNAAIYGALQGAAGLADLRKDPDRAAEWRGLAARIKAAVLERLWTGEYFAQSLTTEGALDPRVDSSVLGVIEPFHLLDLDKDTERHMAELTIAAVQRRLGVELEDGPAIRRFEGDRYMGGLPGGVNTTWLARALLRLAHAEAARDPDRALDHCRQAQRYLAVVANRATPAGLLPELIAWQPGHAGWAVPHGWAMANYVACLLALDDLQQVLPLAQAGLGSTVTTGG